MYVKKIVSAMIFCLCLLASISANEILSEETEVSTTWYDTESKQEFTVMYTDPMIEIISRIAAMKENGYCLVIKPSIKYVDADTYTTYREILRTAIRYTEKDQNTVMSTQEELFTMYSIRVWYLFKKSDDEYALVRLDFDTVDNLSRYNY